MRGERRAGGWSKPRPGGYQAQANAQAWREWREGEVQAQVGPQASRVEAWPIWKRIVLGGSIMLAISAGAFAMLLLLASRADRTGAIVVGVFLGVVLLAAMVAFTIAPGSFLRFLARSSTSGTDPAESPPWNIPG